MSNDELVQLMLKLAGRLKAETFGPAALQRALDYPWARPEGSFVLRNGQPRPLEKVEAATLPIELDGRLQLLAIGANGAPERLATKLTALPEDDRDVLVLTGTLRDHVVTHSAHLAAYGSLPATLAQAPGASSRAATLMVTEAQLEALTQTELSYLLVRLDGGSFEPDLPIEQLGPVFAYLSRWGEFAPDGEHTRLMGQSAVLDRAAPLVLGGDASGTDLVRRTTEDFGWAVEHAWPRLRAHARPIDRGNWTIFPS